MRMLLASALTLVLVACGSSTSSPDDAARPTPAPTPTLPPESVVEQLVRALDEGDCEAAKDAVLTPSALDCDLVEESRGQFDAEGIDPEEVRYRTTERVGDSATVHIDWGTKDAPGEEYQLVRVDGAWKVEFDSAA
jgi:hypothetical protein